MDLAFSDVTLTFSSIHSDTTDRVLMKLDCKLLCVSHWAVAFSKLDYFAQGWCHADCLCAICNISVITDWILMKTGVKLIWQLHFGDFKLIPAVKTVINGPIKSCFTMYFCTYCSPCTIKYNIWCWAQLLLSRWRNNVRIMFSWWAVPTYFTWN